MAGLRVSADTAIAVNKLGEQLAMKLGLKHVSQDYVVKWLLGLAEKKGSEKK